MSPSQDPSTRQRNQFPTTRQNGARRARRPRSRQCLLKGCEKSFRPRHAMTRYCSEDCRQKARQWSQWKSQQRWRQSENGRKKRIEQSARHRQRLRIAGRASYPAENGVRGSSPSASSKNFLVIPVIVPAATKASNRTGGHHCSDSAVTPVGAHWNGCWNAKGDGSSVANAAARRREKRR
jgi:hypothetical protein